MSGLKVDDGDYKPQASLACCKRLLRVRGIKEVEAEINFKRQALADIVNEAREYYRECSKIQFVYNICYQPRYLKYKNVPIFDKRRYHIPLINFCSWYVDDKTAASKRQTFFSWDEISLALDKANASLDERLIHMRVFWTFRDFANRGRQISEDLKVLYNAKAEFESLVLSEHMHINSLPQFMLQSLEI